jgi:hypothetical protein
MRVRTIVACLLIQATSVAAQDARSLEITAIDAACQERNQLQCMSDMKGGCDGGQFTVAVETETVPTLPGIRPIGIPKPKPQCTYSDFGAASNSIHFIDKMKKCQQLVTDFPSLYGEQCLKPMGGERMLTATGPDLSYLLKKLCESLNMKDCETIE